MVAFLHILLATQDGRAHVTFAGCLHSTAGPPRIPGSGSVSLSVSSLFRSSRSSPSPFSLHVLPSLAGPGKITSLPGANFSIPFDQFADFITVNESHGRKLFYWSVGGGAGMTSHTYPTSVQVCGVAESPCQRPGGSVVSGDNTTLVITRVTAVRGAPV